MAGLDDTSFLLVTDVLERADRLDLSLDTASRTTVTWIALQAKTDAYDLRVTRSLAAAANLGATLSELADAVGMSQQRVVDRLADRPELLTPESLDRLGITEAITPPPQENSLQPHPGGGRLLDRVARLLGR